MKGRMGVVASTSESPRRSPGEIAKAPGLKDQARQAEPHVPGRLFLKDCVARPN